MKPFLRRTLLDHFVVGEVDPSKVKAGDEFETVGGRKVTFTTGVGGPGRLKMRYAYELTSFDLWYDDCMQGFLEIHTLE